MAATALRIVIAYTIALTFIIGWNIFLCKVVWGRLDIGNVSASLDPYQVDLVGWKPLQRMMTTWGLLHVVFYANLAYAFPEYMAVFFVVGVIWEGIEALIKRFPVKTAGCNLALTVNAFYETEAWWDGRWQDIVLNVAGLILGWGLSRVGLPWPKLIGGLVYLGVLGLPLIITAARRGNESESKA